MASIWKHPKSKYWYARYLHADGRWHNASTSTTNRKDALKIAEEYETAGRARRTATQVRRVISRLHAEITGEALPRSSARAFVESWLRGKEGTAPATQVFYQNSTKQFLAHLGTLADDELSMITQDHITNFRNAIRKRLSAKATNHHLKVVKMLFRAARREHLIVDDPSEFVKTMPEKRAGKKPRRPFSLDEIRALLPAADDEWRSMILFGLYTGQRLGDIAKYTWANLDLAKSQVRLVTSKQDTSLVIPMAPRLREHIKTMPLPDAAADITPLHPRAHAILTKDGKSGRLSNQFANLMALAGLRKKKAHRVTTGEGRAGRHENGETSFHSLRHSAVTLLKEAGVPSAVVQALIGHESQQMSELYTTVGEEALTKAAAAFPTL